MKSWLLFSVVYTTVVGVAVVIRRSAFKTRWSVLFRATVATTLILWVGDQIAESRGLWLLSRPSNLFLFDVPLENLALTGAAVIHALLCYVSNHVTPPDTLQQQETHSRTAP